MKETMGDMCHKTVFVLDHCKQMKEPTGVSIDIDLGPKTPGSGAYFQFIPSLMKSLWSCMAEGTLEYARILWDLFGDERLVRFVTSNPQKAICLNDWSKPQQTMTFAHEAFAAAGPPLGALGNIQVGIASAIKALSEPTPAQAKAMAEAAESKERIVNKGRIVCITSVLIDLDIREFLLASLSKNQAAVAGNPRKLPIEEIEFTLISLHPVGKESLSRVLSQPMKEISKGVKFEIMVVLGPDLCERLQQIGIQHHDLVTTVVTGIPMKEEANASLSLNYDVPMFHPRIGPIGEAQMLLKWSGPTAPKGIGAHLCNIACRITPVEVISRPTTCLSNFVLSGRSVWLENMKKTKASCNLLMSHGGELWMHVMESARNNVLEDPPSISEGSGGRVTDYRIPDFVEFMKQNLLTPYPPSESTDPLCPKERAKQRLWRKTSYWPITMSSSLLYSLPGHLDTLLKYFPNDKLDDMQKIECDKSFWNLMTVEARGDPPPLSSYLKKGQKKDEQWRAVYSEVETFLRANLHSPAHQSVLDCFVESHRKDDKADGASNGERMKRPASNGGFKKELSPPAKKPKLANDPGSPKLNLLALWQLKIEKRNVKMIPEGVKLYAHLKETSAETPIKTAK